MTELSNEQITFADNQEFKNRADKILKDISIVCEKINKLDFSKKYNLVTKLIEDIFFIMHSIENIFSNLLEKSIAIIIPQNITQSMIHKIISEIKPTQKCLYMMSTINVSNKSIIHEEYENVYNFSKHVFNEINKEYIKIDKEYATLKTDRDLRKMMKRFQ